MQKWLLLSALCLTVPAFAQVAPVKTFDLERLELNPSGIGSIAVGSGELLPAQSFRSSVLAHYQHDPLVLRDARGNRTGEVVHERLTLHLIRQYSLNQRVEFALQVPIIVYQSGDDLTGVGLPRLANGGLGTPFLSARLALVRSLDGAPFDLALQAGTGLPFGNGAAFARDEGLTFAPRVLVTKRVNQFIANVELGGLLRPPSVLAVNTVHNELQGHASVGTHGAALRGEVGVRSAWFFGRSPNSYEVFAGPRYAVTDQVELVGLGAVGLGSSPGTPMFRVLFGVSFFEGVASKDFGKPTPLPDVPLPVVEAPKPAPVIVNTCEAGKPHDPAACPDLDLDLDQIKNAADKCPDKPEDKDGFQDEDGCAEEDNDADGVKDGDDKCPVQAGTVAYAGCAAPDQDNDGVLDEKDKCPAEAGIAAKEGCPLRDGDKDGVEDDADACPKEPGAVEHKGCPPPVGDSDNDGVKDGSDNCPKEAGPAKNQGCPVKERQLVVITKRKLVIKDKVHFAEAKATLLPRSNKLLDQVANILMEHPEIKRIRIEGHTDNKGLAAANLRLSQDRANAVRNYLIKRGIEKERLAAKGYGSTQPAFPNMSPAGREKNRRVEFTILDTDE